MLTIEKWLQIKDFKDDIEIKLPNEEKIKNNPRLFVDLCTIICPNDRKHKAVGYLDKTIQPSNSIAFTN